jgi:predicted DCC family thiol-disulfide oxidoreductase YuxK
MRNSLNGDKHSEKYILLFDGVCNLCNSLVNFIIKRDPAGKFKFAALQSESAKSLLISFDLEASDLDTFVLINGDRSFSKSTAALHVLKELGGAWKLMYVFIYIPKPLRDAVYDLVARTRYKVFGRRDKCMIPTTDIKDRFL